jgi:flagellar basal-body rod protein FlgB
MALDLFNDPTLTAMGQYMSRLSSRQQVVSSNVANIDTPGYRAKDVSFHATMQELLSESALPARTTQPEHSGQVELNFAPPGGIPFEVQGLPERADGNNVDIDKEMLKLGETSFAYTMMSQLLRVKFRTLAGSINEGRAS